ncbi:MAG: hypothetical protein H0U16_04825, partial [Actinobacteria bacterium]|nr:hypothetical protein [Actinomycetota bacterium]
GWVAGSQSALKNAATAAESFATGTGGDYTGMDLTALETEGLQTAQNVVISVTSATANDYCLTATHGDLAAAHAWQVSTYDSDEGEPSSGAC